MKHRFPDEQSAAEALAEAQRVAWAPMVFQCAVSLRRAGVFAALVEAPQGLDRDELRRRTTLSDYTFTVLLEAGSGAGMLSLDGQLVQITKLGYMLERDEMTRINLDFVRDVCYRGLDRLPESFERGRPVGLTEYAPAETTHRAKTVYEALGHLPPRFEASWYSFDHFYSDRAFPVALRHVLEAAPMSLLDVGGNTGKWATLCLQAREDLNVTVLDHPAHAEQIRRLAEDRGFGSRLRAEPIDLLDHDSAFPSAFDMVWMSQLLVCFAPDDIVKLLERARAALAPGGRLFVLETFWDRQSGDTGRFTLQQLSLYFTCIANGRSRVYDSNTLLECLERAGFVVASQVDEVGQWHTLLKATPKAV